ncbi:MAG: hypothetical protein ACFE9T_08675 [Promethearchaeota archaeon]
MVYNDKLELADFIGHHTLLYGDTNTKKTYYTAKFIQFLVESKNYNPKQISILDFAPKVCFFKSIKTGGRLQDYYQEIIRCNNFQFEGEIIPPRLKARNKRELYEYMCHNYKLTSNILKEFNQNPTKILIINDISIYLHLGDKKYLLETINKTSTFLGNSYYGRTIKRKFASLLSLRERYYVEYLIKNIESAYLTGEK